MQQHSSPGANKIFYHQISKAMAKLHFFSFFSKRTRKNYRLFIGLNDKNTLIQEINTQEARGIIARVCGDCTLSEAAGVYTMQSNGVQVSENTVICDLFGRTWSEIVDICEALKISLNQESIAVMEVKNPTTFI